MLRTASLPPSLAVLPTHAFEKCPHLQTVNFSEGLRAIGYGAFGSCPALHRLALPASVETLSTITTPEMRVTLTHPSPKPEWKTVKRRK